MSKSIDIKENLSKKSKDLIRQARQLPKIKITWETPISVKCDKLTNRINDKKLISLISKSKKPAIYYFEILDENISYKYIVEKLKEYKAKKKRSCPKIHRELENSYFLYCGSVEGAGKQDLHGRFIQHLGYGSKNTYSLQLKHWAKHIKLELHFHYAFLPPDKVPIIKLIESSLAIAVKPLVGKVA